MKENRRVTSVCRRLRGAAFFLLAFGFPPTPVPAPSPRSNRPTPRADDHGGGGPGGPGLNPGGGIPGGGIPGRNPGGGIPGGGIPGLNPGGGMPGGIPPAIGGAENCGIMCAPIAPPTPRTGPASPGGGAPGTVPGTTPGIPRPAAFPIPTPGGACCACARLSSCGGGPSTVRETTSSPRRSKNPRTRRTWRSSSVSPFFGGSFLNSSASPSTMFMWRSNAMNRPTIWRPSTIVTRIR
eukprot:31085-Pelagococcus_subviridis.AAC.16